jgi:hypothetical protein
VNKFAETYELDNDIPEVCCECNEFIELDKSTSIKSLDRKWREANK